MKNCFIYCRVSTEEQADKGYSLDAQEKLCQDFAERSGYAVTAVYREEGKTATNLNRPALKELLSRCTKGSSISAVIVQETDRLARNTKDHLTIKAMLKKAGARLISVAQPMLDDSPEGKMVDTILAGVNQFQSDINGRKTSRGMQEKFEQGWWPSWAPLGYLNVAIAGNAEGVKDANIIGKDPGKWELVRECFHLYLTGNYSVVQINDILYDKGLRSKHGKKISHSIMVKILKNPFYAGMMRWGDQTRQGRHEPMITMEQHRQIQTIMDSHNLHACRRRKHSFLLRGFVICNRCGHRYTAEVHAAKNKAYYRCASLGKHSNLNQNIEAARLEHNVEKLFETVQFTEKFTEEIIFRLRGVYLAQRDSTNAQKQVLFNQKKAVEAKRDTAEEKLLDGIISDEDFVRLRKKFSDQLAGIQNRIEELDYQKETDIDTVHEILKFSRNISKTYREASYEMKRKYLALFWREIYVQDRRIVRAVPTELIHSLQSEKKVLIRNDWQPSPALNGTLRNWEYMAELKKRLEEILGVSNEETALRLAA